MQTCQTSWRGNAASCQRCHSTSGIWRKFAKTDRAFPQFAFVSSSSSSSLKERDKTFQTKSCKNTARISRAKRRRRKKQKSLTRELFSRRLGKLICIGSVPNCAAPSLAPLVFGSMAHGGLQSGLRRPPSSAPTPGSTPGWRPAGVQCYLDLVIEETMSVHSTSLSGTCTSSSAISSSLSLIFLVSLFDNARGEGGLGQGGRGERASQASKRPRRQTRARMRSPA